MAELNPDLVAMHRSLIALSNTMLEQMNAAADTGNLVAMDAIHAEMPKVAMRIGVAGQKLLAARTEAITAAVAEVARAETQVKAAIARLDRINDFIQSITGFLGLVDKVLAIALPG